MNELLLEAHASEEIVSTPEATTIDYSSMPTQVLETSRDNHSRRAVELEGSEDPMDKEDFDHASEHVDLITDELTKRVEQTPTDFSHENIDELVDDAQDLAVPESAVLSTIETSPLQPEADTQSEVTAEELQQAEDKIHEALRITNDSYAVFEAASDEYIALLEKAKGTNTLSV
jgi:hypothetical protein